MKTDKRFLLAALAAVLLPMAAARVQAQTCAPTATFSYVDKDGQPVEEEMESYSGSAPVTAVFRANPADVGNYDVRYEWRIFEPGRENAPLVHRFEENLEYTFTASGSFYVKLNATFVLNTDTIAYPEEGEESYFQVSIAESKLEMPNAFSPNGDGFNDTYRVKDHQSIVSFKATVFNRWGKRLYSWSDVNGEWDGKVGGRTVPDGVYFVNVTAKGADGHNYHIRKDINVLTRTIESGTSTSETP